MKGLLGTHNIILVDENDLRRMFEGVSAEAKVRDLIAKFDNVLVGIKEVAKFHSVSEKTVANYIKDGLIETEQRDKDTKHPRFRLSYVLTLDFREMKRQLKERKADNENK